MIIISEKYKLVAWSHKHIKESLTLPVGFAGEKESPSVFGSEETDMRSWWLNTTFLGMAEADSLTQQCWQLTCSAVSIWVQQIKFRKLSETVGKLGLFQIRKADWNTMSLQSNKLLFAK